MTCFGQCEELRPTTGSFACDPVLHCVKSRPAQSWIPEEGGMWNGHEFNPHLKPRPATQLPQRPMHKNVNIFIMNWWYFGMVYSEHLGSQLWFCCEHFCFLVFLTLCDGIILFFLIFLLSARYLHFNLVAICSGNPAVLEISRILQLNNDHSYMGIWCDRQSVM